MTGTVPGSILKTNHLLSPSSLTQESCMHAPFLTFLADARGDMVEGALTLPLMALLALALVNLALPGHAAVV